MDTFNTPTANKFVFRCYFASNIISVWLINGFFPQEKTEQTLLILQLKSLISRNSPSKTVHLFLERVDCMVFS